jgi:hypothetical protein
MPINPNIALGAQQQQQPVNMLGQMGQLYALKAAKQEFEGGEALRDAFASGGDLNDPAFIQRLRAANPKMALDIEAKHLAGQKTRSELEAAAYKNTREALTMVNNPESLRAFSLSQFNDPVIGPRLKAIGLTPEIALANLDKEIATSGFETALKKASMGLDSFFKDQTSRRNTDVSSGAAYGQLALAQKKFDLEQQQQNEINRILRGEAPAITGAPAVTGVPVGGGGGAAAVTGVSTGGPTAATPVGAGSVPTGASAPTATTASIVAPTTNVTTQPNVLATQVAPTTAQTSSVNALGAGAVSPEIAQMQAKINQLIKIGSPKALAAADALIKQHNILMPSQQIVQNTKGEYIRVDQRGGSSTPVLDASGQPLVGKLPPEQFESTYRQVVGKAAGDRDVGITTSATAAAENLPKIYETLDQLRTSDAITGFGANVIKNIEGFRAKFAQDIKAGKKVADTEILDAMLGSDVFPMIQSLGIGAKGLDTPAERDYLRSVMTGTINMDKAALIKLTTIRKNIEERAVKRYNEAIESGKLDKFFETQGVRPEKIEAPKYEPRLKQVDQDALNWAKTNPNDPRAAQILQRLGM